MKRFVRVVPAILSLVLSFAAFSPTAFAEPTAELAAAAQVVDVQLESFLESLESQGVAMPEAQLASTCGGAGQVCCTSGSPCQTGLQCNTSGICRRPCGQPGQSCCKNGAPCAAGATCTNQAICAPCGQIFQLCCPGNVCFTGQCVAGLNQCR